jgi:hypothetical protein
MLGDLLTTVCALMQFNGSGKGPFVVIVIELLPGMSLKNYLNIIWHSQLDTHIRRGLKPGKDALLALYIVNL